MSAVPSGPQLITRDALAKAFAEWERRYRENPDQFSEDWHAATVSTATYGEAASDFLLSVLREQGGRATVAPDQVKGDRP